jgi:F-type H+-transporting ATPase subunit b
MNITATLFIQLFAFALLIFFVNRMLWKPLSTVMADRQKRIEEGLLAAEQGVEEKKLAEQKVKETLNASKAQALEIVNKAQKQATQIVEESKEQAKVVAQKVKVQAQEELSQEVVKVKNDLKKEVSTLVMQGVKSILGKEVDQKTHQEMLSKLTTAL